MAEPELALRFQRRFLAARQLRCFPWPELEEELRTSSGCSVLLAILRQHEATAAEPLDELYETLAQLLKEEESPACYKSYFLPTGESVTLCESLAMVSGGTTGLVTWDAALHLAEWAVLNPLLFTHRTILELGSGAGFTGIAICKACRPRRYIFSDCHPWVLHQLTQNICLNGFSPGPAAAAHTQGQSQAQGAAGASGQAPQVMVADLDWGSVTQSQLLALQPEVILAADVIYDPEIILALIGMLQKLSTCRADGKPPEVYIAATIRNPDTYLLFQARLALSVGLAGRAGSESAAPWDGVLDTVRGSEDPAASTGRASASSSCWQHAHQPAAAPQESPAHAAGGN
ncbi:protein-lysine N-methyltransferase EEF2KMT isoform X2 [Melanerpes formicivorus]|uniref:protein-lysine N-methyltransferase EEF2KMT isoform X2 n=1 Tax=Melanerpes formicivorus TaxID=211600 RepID=UPI00358EA4B6